MVKEMLSVGEENATPTKELMNRTQKTERELRDIVRQERQAGALICSSQSGYFLPRTITDVAATVNRLLAISKETKAIADAMAKEAECMKEEMAKL